MAPLKGNKALRRQTADLRYLARLLEMSPDQTLRWLQLMPVRRKRPWGKFTIWRRTSTVITVLNRDTGRCVFQGSFSLLFRG